MRVMVIVKAMAAGEVTETPKLSDLDEMGRFNDQLRDAGILISADGLKPSSFGKRVVFDGASRSVVDGPFAETRELIAGFWIWEVRDMDEAVAWVKRCPNPMPGLSDIEIRPIWSMSELG